MSECKRERERESKRRIHKKRGWSRDEKRVHVVENKCE